MLNCRHQKAKFSENLNTSLPCITVPMHETLVYNSGAFMPDRTSPTSSESDFRTWSGARCHPFGDPLCNIGRCVRGERVLGERHVTSVGSSPGGNIIVKRDHAARSVESACACDNHVMAAAVDLGQRDGVDLPGEGIGEPQRSLRIAATAHMVAVEVNAANEVFLPRCLQRPTWLAITADVERVGLPAPDQAALHRV